MRIIFDPDLLRFTATGLSNRPVLALYALAFGVLGGAISASLMAYLYKQFEKWSPGSTDRQELRIFVPFIFVLMGIQGSITGAVQLTGALEALHHEPTPGERALDYLAHNEWLTAFVILGTFSIYYLRARFRFAYGLVECVFGATAIWAGLHIRGGQLSLDLTLPSIDDSVHLFAVFLALVSGVYVIIRGLDNMAQKLPPWLVKAWDGVFPGSRRK